jgi:hypothetical protein
LCANNVFDLILAVNRSRTRLDGKGFVPNLNIAPIYSITSSAVICIVNGTARPSAFAVLRLITYWNFVGC